MKQSVPIFRTPTLISAPTLIRAPTVREGSALTKRGAASASTTLVGRRPGPALLLVCMLVATAGCSKGRAYRLGHDAEKRGEAHVAYAYYCQAAVRRPDSGSISASIRRLTPAAATYWKQHAHSAVVHGRYADAWRMAMRCLRVQPDDAEAAALVRQLESDHSMAVASARQAYERRGPRTLAIALQRADAVKTSEPPAGGSPGLPSSDADAADVMASVLAGVGRGAGAASAATLAQPADDATTGENDGATPASPPSRRGVRPPLTPASP